MAVNSDDRKVKVWNRTKGLHHFVFSDGIKKLPIAPDGFQKIPVGEVYYVDQTSRSFKKGLLEIDSAEKELIKELGYENRNSNTLTPREIIILLNGEIDENVKKKLSGINERHGKEKLINVARSMDLPHSKILFVESITGMKVYHELIQEEEKNKKQEENENKK